MRSLKSWLKKQGWKRFFKTYGLKKAVDIAIKYKKQAKAVGKKVSLPKEVVLAILFRELICYDIIDDVGNSWVMNYFYYTEQQERYQKASWRERPFIDARPSGVMVDDCSNGLGQIFCSTAIKSNNYAIGKHLLSGKTYKWSNWKHRKKFGLS